jgi:hypothetical protein
VKRVKCITRQCRNSVASAGKSCSTCRSRKCRKADPVRYAFNNIRNRAKQRNILFTITLEQFRTWCHKVKYIGLKGRSSESYTIDRKHNDLGYHLDNIQVMTNRENVKKYFMYDWRTKTGRVIEGSPVDKNPYF